MTDFDVVIVGSGFAGANMAYLLGLRKKRVLIIEAGPGIEHSREDYMENFFLNMVKTPSAPYPPDSNGLDPSHTNAPRPTVVMLGEWNDPEKSYLTYDTGSLPFGSSYERMAGGTGNHWMGTALRMADNDFKLNTTYGKGLDWPIGYDDLESYYGDAEALIGVSADVSEQEKIGTQFPSGYSYPMDQITQSYWDEVFTSGVDGNALTSDNSAVALTTATPAGRNSQPVDPNRRVCHGNTNCTPICPIQAKYDPQYTLRKAFDTGYVEMISQSVVDYITMDSDGQISGVHYITYDDTSVPATGGKTGEGTKTGTIYVLAAHAVENARILLNTELKTGKKVANSSGFVGQNLMDHPLYLAWGLMPTPIYCYRGPIATSGLENLRDGSFRSTRAAWRIEIGNEGWSFPIQDPYTTGKDYLYGLNNSGLNPNLNIYANTDYQNTLNDLLTRQFRFAYLVEQDAQTSNAVTLNPDYTDNLNIPRPLVNYNFSDYTKAGFESAREATGNIMSLLGATEYTSTDPTSGTYFKYNNQGYNYVGAGHYFGTHIMGTTSSNSVVNDYQKSWDHTNMYLAGCGSMPSSGTQNPTLTMLAMCVRTVDDILTQI